MKSLEIGHLAKIIKHCICFESGFRNGPGDFHATCRIPISVEIGAAQFLPTRYAGARPGYDPRRDGPHHGDWPYVTINGTAADAFIALGAAIKEGLSLRSMEQSWFVYPEAPCVPVGQGISFRFLAVPLAAAHAASLNCAR